MNISWLVFSLLASVFQAIRHTSSKTLAHTHNVHLVTLIRFGYALPFAVVFVVLLMVLGFSIGKVSPVIFIYTSFIAFMQILSNALLVLLFRRKGFSVVINFTKSDTIAAALLGVLFFSEPISLIGWIAILVSLSGVIIANSREKKKGFKKVIFERGVVLGLSIGALYALASFFVKLANSSYTGGILVANASFTLFLVLAIQTGVLLLFLFTKRRNDLRVAFTNSRGNYIIGFASFAASILWFVSYSLAPVAYVRTVGQAEIIITLLVSHMLFKEKLLKREFVGIALTVGGILLLSFAG